MMAHLKKKKKKILAGLVGFDRRSDFVKWQSAIANSYSW